MSPGPRAAWLEHRTVPAAGTKAERRAARERVSACHQAQLAELLSHLAVATDRYRAGDTGACAVDDTIHHYHRAAGELWKFCFSSGGGTRAEFIAGLLDRMATGAEPIDWWERHTATTPAITAHTRCSWPPVQALNLSQTVAAPHHG